MLARSKAAQALMRLEQLDRKYNAKRIPGNVSTESSLDEDYLGVLGNEERRGTSHVRVDEANVAEVPVKPRMEIRIPSSAVGRDEDSSITDSAAARGSSKSKSKSKSTSQRDNGTPLENESKVQRPLELLPHPVSKVDSSVASSVATVLSRRSEDSSRISEAIQSVDDKSTSREIKEAHHRSRTASSSDHSCAPITENVDGSKDSREDKEQGSRYEDDSFEEASSGSTSAALGSSKSSAEDAMVSGVKEIKITPHKHAQAAPRTTTAQEDRDKRIVELVPPKVLRSASECDVGLDEELSRYVRSTENADQAVPVSLLKLRKQATPRKHARRGRRPRKPSDENTDSSAVSDHGKLTGREGNDPVANTSATWTRGDRVEDAEEEDDGAANWSSDEKLLRETPRKSDVTGTLRDLNKDAINAIVRRRRVQARAKEVPPKSGRARNHGTVLKIPPLDVAGDAELDNSDWSSRENVGTAKHGGHEQRSRDRRIRTRRYPRQPKCSRKAANGGKVEGKRSRFECRQRPWKHAAAPRLPRESEAIREYLIELERTRLELGPGASAPSARPAPFRPLEFPKIAAFFGPDTELEESLARQRDRIAGLQERLLIVRQWLKDRYILYRDYSNLARTVNAKYIPASLEDAKRTIRQLQSATIKSR